MGKIEHFGAATNDKFRVCRHHNKSCMQLSSLTWTFWWCSISTLTSAGISSRDGTIWTGSNISRSKITYTVRGYLHVLIMPSFCGRFMTVRNGTSIRWRLHFAATDAFFNVRLLSAVAYDGQGGPRWPEVWSSWRQPDSSQVQRRLDKLHPRIGDKTAKS